MYLIDFFTLGDLLPVMCDRAGFIQDTSLILYEVCLFYLSVVTTPFLLGREVVLLVLKIIIAYSVLDLCLLFLGG